MNFHFTEEQLAIQETLGRNEWRVRCGRDAKDQISPTDMGLLPFSYPIQEPNQDLHRNGSPENLSLNPP